MPYSPPSRAASSEELGRLLGALQVVLVAAAIGLAVIGLRPPGTEQPFALAETTAAERSRLARSMAEIGYDADRLLPGWTVEVAPPREGVAGYTWTRDRTIEIFADPSWDDEYFTRVLAHELGHALDLTHNDGDDRRRWLEARGVPEAPWWPGDGAADFATGAGDFAESFAFLVTGEDFRGELAGPPGPEQVALLEDLIGG